MTRPPIPPAPHQLEEQCCMHPRPAGPGAARGGTRRGRPRREDRRARAGRSRGWTGRGRASRSIISPPGISPAPRHAAFHVGERHRLAVADPRFAAVARPDARTPRPRVERLGRRLALPQIRPARFLAVAPVDELLAHEPRHPEELRELIRAKCARHSANPTVSGRLYGTMAVIMAMPPQPGCGNPTLWRADRRRAPHPAAGTAAPPPHPVPVPLRQGPDQERRRAVPGNGPTGPAGRRSAALPGPARARHSRPISVAGQSPAHRSPARRTAGASSCTAAHGRCPRHPPAHARPTHRAQLRIQPPDPPIHAAEIRRPLAPPIGP